jgi:hypothetical protein
LENNDKNENYTFNKEKMKYESKISGKRISKHYTITTYDKCMDKIRRDRKVLNYGQKILKYFYSNQFKVDNYEKENEDYKCWYKKFIRDKLKEHYEWLLLNNDGHSPPQKEGYSNSTFSTTSTPMLSQPLHELKLYSRKKSNLKYETLHDSGSEMKMFTGTRSAIEIHHDD